MSQHTFEKTTTYQNLHPAMQHGDGISRPKPKARTRPYRVVVILDGNQRMTVTMPAESMARAKLYAKNRWPGSEINVSVIERPSN